MRHAIRIAVLSLAAASSPAASESAGPISEVKFGVLAHDVRIVAADTFESGIDINGEVLFVSPAFLAPVWKPRPHLGVQGNTSGDTSQVYAGLTWTFDIAKPVWLGLSVGGALHNGETSRTGLNRKAFGSSALFRLSAELGVDMGDHLNLSLYFDHESNAFLADRNPGIDNVGARIGWKF